MANFQNLEIVSAIWYDRPATLKESTEQLLAFLLQLKAHNPTVFGVWYQGGKSRKDALQKRVEFDYDSIKRVFSKRIKNEDLYPETTYKAYVWNGDNDLEAVSMSACLGAGGHRLYPNSLDLDLAFSGPAHDYYKDPTHQEALINLVKEYWSPEKLCVKSWQGDFIDLLASSEKLS